MLSVTSWVCKCGAEVKVMYDTDGVTMILCPKPPCQLAHPVQGKVSDLWIKDPDKGWLPLNVAPYIVSA
jgi:hypothetical protein